MSPHRVAPRSPARRRLLQGLSGACALAPVRPSRSDDVRATASCGAAHGPLAFRAGRDGAAFINLTLVVRCGEPFRVVPDNALDAPTIAHWHGLTVDTRGVKVA